MVAILSEISNKVNISSLKDTFTEVYASINDKITKIKDAISVTSDEKKPEEKKEEKKESYADPPATKTTKDKIFEFLTKLKDYFIIAGTILLKIIFYVFLASLVANDMMMYAPTIRAFFFVFTLILTYTITPYAFFLSCYYALRKGYDYYHQKLSSEIVKPPISFPMIFAILPLTTTYPESPIVRFFMWAFMYQKSNKQERMTAENNRLESIMTEYWNDLNKSFDYLDKIKTTEPFSRLYELNKEHLETKTFMHPIQKPDIVVVSSKTLPDVIGEKKEEAEKAEEKKTFFPPQSKEQANKAAANKAETNKVAAATNANITSVPIITSSPLPPVIQQKPSVTPPANNSNMSAVSSLSPTIQSTNSINPPLATNSNASVASPLPSTIKPVTAALPN